MLKLNDSEHSQENCLHEDGPPCKFDESPSAFNIYEQFVNLDVLTELLVGKNKFVTIAEEMKSFIGVDYIMPVNQMPSTPKYCDAIIS